MTPTPAHVLVVDDQEDNRGLLIQLLRRSGHRVSEALNGHEALSMIEADRPDLVLLDLMMPVLDGFGVLEELHRRGGPFLPVVVVSAASDREARLRALELGAHEFLNKPIDSEELRIRVRTLLALKASEAENREARAQLELANQTLHATTVEQQTMLERIIEEAPAGMAFLDRQLIYRWANPAILAMVGLTAEQALGHGVSDLFGTETGRELEAHLRRVLETGEPFQATAMPLYSGSTGRTTYWDTTCTAIADAEGRVQGVLVLSLEVSARIEKERLQEANIAQLEAADRYKDEFLSVISHELRTPLNFIMGFASLLDDEVQGPLNQAQHEALGRVLSGADRMLGLVDDLLDVARIQSGKLGVVPEPTAYPPLVADALEHMHPLAAQAGVQLSSEVDVAATLVIDGPRIGQVLTNLVSNAIKFSPAGKTVSVRAFQRGGKVVTEVEDEGEGLRPDDIVRLFQRFGQLDMSKTRRTGGAGLGLAICKALVEAHGGEIGVHSDGPGHGCLFWFTLPL